MPQIKAHILDPSGVARRAWPVSTGIPFAKGRLKSARNVRVLDAKGKELPSHADVRATWPDGSIKWVLVDFQTDIEPMEKRHFSIDFGPRVRRKAVAAPVRVTHRDGEMEIDTGAARVTLGTKGGRLLRQVAAEGRGHLSSGDEGEFTATDAEGKVYRSQVACAYVEEENPLKVVVKAQGGFVAEDGTRLMSWVVRVCACAGHPFLRVYHTFVHDQPAAFVHLKALRLSLPLAEEGPKRAFFGGRNNWFGSGHILEEVTERVAVTQPAPYLYAFTKVSGERQIYRANVNGWVHVAGEQTGVTVKLRRPSYAYPKAVATDGRVIDLDLYPALSPEDATDAGAGKNYREFMEQTTAVLHVGPLKAPQGMARTHEVFLSFGPPKADERKADMECIAFEQPLLPVLPSEWYARSGALGAMAPYLKDHWPLEQRMREMCVLPDGMGILNDGDKVTLANVGGQARTITTDNAAYDISRSLVRTFMRTGHQMTFWAAEAGVHHLIDVDTIHANAEHPEWVGGPHMQWAQNHHYRTTDEAEQMPPVTSHTWIGGLLDFYFLTGYRRAWDVACQTAEFCRVRAPVQWLETMTPEAKARVLDPEQQWSYSTRVAGWALVGMGQMYEVTREEKFVGPMKRLVDMFVTWQDRKGKWRDQTGSFNRGSKPFMIASVLQGLQKYYENFKEKRVLDVILLGAKHVATEAKTAEGIMFYTEGPHSDRPHSSDVMMLGPMAFAFEKGGDPDVLDAAYRHFRWMVDGKQCAPYTHKDVFAFLPLALKLGLLEDYRGVDVQKHIPKKRRPPQRAQRAQKKARGG